jgi:hypothetical protein
MKNISTVIYNKVLPLLHHNLRRFLYSKRWTENYNYHQRLRTICSEENYSYLPFDKFNCIFVHIPKAAGVSIAKGLFDNLAGGHATINDYQIIFSKKQFDSYFKFTFVRNPWDRAYSAYNFLCKGGFNDKDKAWASKYLSDCHSFEDFIVNYLPKEQIMQSIHFKPQSDFICTNNGQSLNIDFIGFFENIADDYNLISNSMLNTTSIKPKTLKQENRTDINNKKSYINAYTKETESIIAKLYNSDIELLGYTFDNSSLPMQISNRMKGKLLN